MDDSQEAILRRIVRDNQEARARFSGLAARTSSAVVAGNWDELGPIIKEAGSDGHDDNEPTGNDTAEDQAGSPS